MKNNAALQKFMEQLKMNALMTRMIFTLAFAMLSVHLMACFWFLAAKFDDLNP